MVDNRPKHYNKRGVETPTTRLYEAELNRRYEAKVLRLTSALEIFRRGGTPRNLAELIISTLDGEP